MRSKTKILPLLLVMPLISVMAVMFSTGSVAASDTYVSVVNPVDGLMYFNYSNTEPPPTMAGYPLGYVLVNMTVTDVTDLAGYQLNLTWDPELLEIASSSDVWLPSDHVFAGLNPQWVPPNIDNVVGYLGASCVRGPGSETFTGSGTMIQVKFNVTKGPPGLGEKYSCYLHVSEEGLFPTELRDSGMALISFTPQDGYYEYYWPTYVSVVNPVDGLMYFNYSNTEPPPTEAGYPLGYVLVNVTVTDVTGLIGWLVNLTWDLELLEIASSSDVWLPSDHVFAGLNPQWVPPNIDNTTGYLGASCARGPDALDENFTGSGTMLQIKFNVTKVPGSSEVLSCDLHLGLTGLFPTELRDTDLKSIPFTPQGGYYQYWALVDSTPPVIGTPVRVPDDDVEPYRNVTVYVNVTDELSGVKNVTLTYTTDNWTTWTHIPMDPNETSGLYEATIPGQPADTWVKFKITAYDNAENKAERDGTEAHFIYLVIPEFPSTMVLLLLMMATSIAVAMMKSKHLRKHNNNP